MKRIMLCLFLALPLSAAAQKFLPQMLYLAGKGAYNANQISERLQHQELGYPLVGVDNASKILEGQLRNKLINSQQRLPDLKKSLQSRVSEIESERQQRLQGLIKPLQSRVSEYAAIVRYCHGIYPSVVNGSLDQQPLELLRIANMAFSVNDICLYWLCIGHAVSDYLTVRDISAFISLDNNHIADITDDLIMYMAKRNYVKKFTDDSAATLSIDSAAIADRDELLVLSRQCAPELTPLIKLGYVDNPNVYTKELEDVAQGILSGSMSYSSDFDELILYNLFCRLYENGDFSRVVGLYESPAFKLVADKYWDCMAMLSVAAISIGMEDKSAEFYGKAISLDKESAEDYYMSINRSLLEYLKEHPDETELQKELFACITPPDEFAVELIDTYYTKIFDSATADDECEDIVYIDMSLIKCYIDGIISVADIAMSYPELTDESQPYIRAMRAYAFSLLSEDSDSAFSEIDRWFNYYADDTSELVSNNKLFLVIAKAKIVEAGVEYPKKALKIMNEYEKLAAGENICNELKYEYYYYLSAIYRHLGKNKKSEKFKTIAEQFKAIES